MNPQHLSHHRSFTPRSDDGIQSSEMLFNNTYPGLRHGARTGTQGEQVCPIPRYNKEYTEYKEHIQPNGNTITEESEPWWSFRDTRYTKLTSNARQETTTETMPREAVGSTPNAGRMSRLSSHRSRDDLFEKMTEILENLCRRNPVKPLAGSLPYIYSGQIEEDPIWFTRMLEEFFQNEEILRDADRINYFGEQLQGEARKWYVRSTDLSMTYAEFKQSFLQKYHSYTCWTKARAELYGTNQSHRDNTEKFITYKKKLFNKLEPNTPESIRIQIITDQLRPAIRSRLRGPRFMAIEEFISTVKQLEIDLEEETREWRLEAGSEHNSNTIERPAHRTFTPTRSTQRTSNGPSTQCRYCAAWHFHSECPNNPYRRNLNDRGAGAIQTRVPQPAPRNDTRTQNQANSTFTNTGATERN